MSMTRRTDSSPPPDATVFVVDDDDAMRDGLAFLIRAAGYEARTFDSAQAFLDACGPTMRGCLLLDVRMPGMSGLELQEQLQSRRITLPVIIVTAYANVPMAVRAMQGGAFDFIEKPFDDTVLINRIRTALSLESQRSADEAEVRKIRRRIDELTPRENEVMSLVVDGLLNKQIAAKLDVSMKTVEIHRSRVMTKMQAESLAQLVRMVIAAGRND